ncbi:hypothetical protein ACHAO7_011688 [Fusarium culmorum]
MWTEALQKAKSEVRKKRPPGTQETQRYHKVPKLSDVNVSHSPGSAKGVVASQPPGHNLINDSHAISTIPNISPGNSTDVLVRAPFRNGPTMESYEDFGNLFSNQSNQAPDSSYIEGYSTRAPFCASFTIELNEADWTTCTDPFTQLGTGETGLPSNLHLA